MVINQNLPAINGFNRLKANNAKMAKALEKLSSGLRIGRAADDAAGLAISEKMRAQIKGLDQAVRNAQDGISLIQTAEGALGEIHSILHRARELAIQSANDTYTADDRMMIQDEVNQLVLEIDRVASSTQFNNKNLLDGTMSAVTSASKNIDVIARGALRIVDEFGQKQAGGGNYNIKVEGEANGVAQVLKSNVFTIKHEPDIGELATAGTSLYDIAQFWDSNGNFILNPPKAIELVQGDGSKAYVSIYGDDTLFSLSQKLSKAIVGDNGLGQNIYGADVAHSGNLVNGLVDSSSVTLASGGPLAAGEYTFRLDGIAFTPPEDAVITLIPGGDEVKIPKNVYDRIVKDLGVFGVTLPAQPPFDAATVTINLDKDLGELPDSANITFDWSTAAPPLDFAGLIGTSSSGHATVSGTILLSSAIEGNLGRINIVGDDAILNALGFSQIREAKDAMYRVEIRDAHTGELVKTGVSTNLITGMIHENIDVLFKPHIPADFDITGEKGYLVDVENADADIFSVHVADRTTILHIGATQKQDLAFAIGNMSAKSLGINVLLVTNNELSNEALGKIDRAISIVSADRAKLGAVQNRLGNTINYLTTASENLTASESRIRDADMAREMMEFTKYNILSQSATAMVSQANTLPQAVLQLLR